jgi:PAS domain S-box-containing protein
MHEDHATAHALMDVLNALPIGLMWKDRDLRFLGVNAVAAANAGLPDAESVVGLTDYDLMGAEQAERIRADDRKVLESGAPVLGVVEMMMTPSGVRCVEISKMPLRDEIGEISGIVSVFRDVSKRHRLQRERMELVQELTAARDAAVKAGMVKNQFFANLSHELRTPLNAILGFAELLEESKPDAAVDADLARIRSAATQLLATLTDMIELAHTQSEPRSIETTDIALGNLIEEVVASSAEAVTSNGNALVVQGVEEPVVAHADRGKLRDCLSVVLSNAGKFTKGGTIRLAVRRDAPDAIAIEIQDSGVGISPPQLKYIFDAFAHDTSSLTQRTGGSGLSLALAQAAMRQMRGDINIYSELGRGTRVTLMVPASAT